MLCWTSHMSGYLVEPIINNEDFKGSFRNVNNCKKYQHGKKGAFKGDGSREALFQGYVRN